MDQVSAPVSLEHSRELRQIRVEQFLGRPGVARSSRIVGETTCPRRPLHILTYRKELHCPDGEADDDSSQRKGEPSYGDRSRELQTVKRREREKERVRSRGEQHVLEKLWMRTQNREADNQCKGTPAP